MTASNVRAQPGTRIGFGQQGHDCTRTAVRVGVVGAIAVLSLAACTRTPAATPVAPTPAGQTTSSTAATTTTVLPTKSILQLAGGSSSLTTLVRLLQTAGLTDTLNGSGTFSLLAPTDDAFARLGTATLDKLTNDTALLKDVLRYHIVPKPISTKDVTAGTVATLEGSTLTLKAGGKLPTVNGLVIVKAARATNGSILVVDTVLIPPDRTLP